MAKKTIRKASISRQLEGIAEATHRISYNLISTEEIAELKEKYDLMMTASRTHLTFYIPYRGKSYELIIRRTD